jgi:DNA mismatch repair protein MSH4
MQEGKCNARVVGTNIKTIIAIKHTMLVMQDIVSTLHMHDDGMESNIHENGDAPPRHHPELLEAIVNNLIPPCARDVLDRITSVITESTMMSKGSLSAQHEECFAVAIGTDGMLDVARKTYLQTVEDIYSHAEALTAEFDCTVKVHNTQARGYHLKLPGSLESIPGNCFIQCVKSTKYIACTTREIASLSDRAQEALKEALAITDRITYQLLVWIQVC